MGRTPSRRLLFDWGPALGYMALIWWLSSQKLDIPVALVSARDKVLHFIEYACLGVVLTRATLRTWPHIRERAAFAALLATFAFGVLDELHQGFVPGRNADPNDVLADGAGAVVGVLLCSAVWARWRRRVRGGVSPP